MEVVDMGGPWVSLGCRSPWALRNWQLGWMGRQRRCEEVLMQKGLGGCNTLSWRVEEELAQQVQGLGRGIRQHLLQGHWCLLLEGDLVVVRQLCDLRPDSRTRGTQDAKHTAQLFNVVFAREQGGPIQQLSHDAAHSPVDTELSGGRCHT